MCWNSVGINKIFTFFNNYFVRSLQSWDYNHVNGVIPTVYVLSQGQDSPVPALSIMGTQWESSGDEYNSKIEQQDFPRAHELKTQITLTKLCNQNTWSYIVDYHKMCPKAFHEVWFIFTYQH